MSHHSPEIELLRRGSDGTWTRQVAGAGGTLELHSIGGSLSVDDVYRRARLTP